GEVIELMSTSKDASLECHCHNSRGHITALHFFWQIRCFDENNPVMAGHLFRRNRDVGLIITAGACIDYAMAYGMV
ncbi:MAG: hypothetical protein ACPH98_01720, partial [Candidatus Puniceispirillales bacterium]